MACPVATLRYVYVPLLLLSAQQRYKTLQYDYPNSYTPQLITLPHAYTELHAHIAASGSADETPAICLLCGHIASAGGQGHCTKHAKQCGKGVCLFFLMQECTVLLVNGKRAAYFPSCYVDEHGEKHRARGRPLFLDPKRYDNSLLIM
jgi:Proteolysis_6 C-terminal